MEEKVRIGLLKSIYEQHWLHARHVEYQRLWFTTVFALIVAGSMASLFTVDEKLLSQFAIYAGFVIFALSILGYFFCLTWRSPLVEHTTLASKMLEADPWLKEYTPYAPGYERLKFLGISAHELFLYFYALMAGMALFLVLYVGLAWCYWWVSIVLFIILCALWRGFFVRQEKEYTQKMGIGYGKYAKKGNS